jgi:hypothetical protein
VYKNCYTNFPDLLSDLDDIWHKKYAQNAIYIWEFLENWCMENCNFPAGTNVITFTHSIANMVFKVMSATSECNILNPDLLKIIEMNVSSVH